MSPDPGQTELQASTFEVILRRKRINLFKIGKLWVLKYFFNDKELFKALAESYNEDKFRFEFKPLVSVISNLKPRRNWGFDYELAAVIPR